MSPILPDHVREAVAARVPVEVREAFDAAVDAHRRFSDSHNLTSGQQRVDVRVKAVEDLKAANRILGAYERSLPQQAARVARTGGAR